MTSCFVIMPFGEKGGVDFDLVLDRIIRPPVEELGITCVRCDDIEVAGDIHQDMFEHIAADHVAIVDITTLNANVFYELGVRHALRPNVTVMLRRRGTESPFNIAGSRAIEYDEADEASVAETREKIARFIRNGMATSESDSPVHDDLPDLRVSLTSKRLESGTELRYAIAGSPGKEIRLVTGDIRAIKGIDVWVNSENTDMQMARFYDRSISGIIRHAGASKNPLGHIEHDTIADELQALMSQYGVRTVPPGTVVATSSGELAASHGVKRIFHAASVTGEIGTGYSPIRDVGQCVANALALADSAQEAEHGLTSILFQIMGSGTARADPGAAAAELLSAAVSYFEVTPTSKVSHADFLITRERTLAVWQGELDRMGDRVQLVG